MHIVIFINLFVQCSKRATANFREVTEWSKVLAWKVSVPQKGTGGSNPFLSADICFTYISVIAHKCGRTLTFNNLYYQN